MNEDSFELRGRGLVIFNPGETTDLPWHGQKLRAVIRRPDGSSFDAEARKEFALHRHPVPHETECFVLLGLSTADVPVGSEVTVMLANDDA